MKINFQNQTIFDNNIYMAANTPFWTLDMHYMIPVSNLFPNLKQTIHIRSLHRHCLQINRRTETNIFRTNLRIPLHFRINIVNKTCPVFKIKTFIAGIIFVKLCAMILQGIEPIKGALNGGGLAAQPWKITETF